MEPFQPDSMVQKIEKEPTLRELYTFFTEELPQQAAKFIEEGAIQQDLGKKMVIGGEVVHDDLTYLDMALGHYIKERLAQIFEGRSDYHLVCEEDVGQHNDNHYDPEVHTTIANVDPVDETTHAKQGGKQYGSLIAVVKLDLNNSDHWQPIASAVYFPALRKLLYTIGEGKVMRKDIDGDTETVLTETPTFTAEDRVRVRASRQEQMEAHFNSEKYDNNPLAQLLKQELAEYDNDTVNLASVCEVIEGEIPGFIYVWKKDKSGGDWDMAAFAVMCKKRGITVCRLDGSEVHFNPADPYEISSEPVMFIWKDKLEELKEKCGMIEA